MRLEMSIRSTETFEAVIELGEREIFMIENYLDDQIFDIYVNRVANGVGVRMLTRDASAALQTVAGKYGKARSNFELRVSNSTHDRVVFVDDRCWVIGPSVKDAARSNRRIS